jgi:hypothetical protein
LNSRRAANRKFSLLVSGEKDLKACFWGPFCILAKDNDQDRRKTDKGANSEPF